MYHNKKEMGMGGKMNYDMGGKMGHHHHDMERAVKIYLMKKGGKTAFPDLTGDGKVTFADILKGRLKKGKKKSMEVGGKNMSESQYLELMRRLDPKGEYRPDRLDLANAERVGQLDAILKMEGNFDKNVSKRSDRFDPTPEGNIRMSVGDIIRQLEDDESAFSKRQSYEQALNQVYSKFPHGKDARTDAENLELSMEQAKVRRKYGMGYGGKVKMMKGGKVEYGMGGKTMEYGLGGMVFKGLNELAQGKGIGAAAKAAAQGFVTPGSGISGAAGLAGTLAQKSNNPMLQNIGKMAGVASNFLPGGNPMGAIGQLMQMRQAEMGMMVPPKMRLLRR